MQQKIVIIGGPGTGKSTVLQELMDRDYFCMQEVSREVTLEAQKKGIEQLFLKDPLLFSAMLLEGRERQYLEAVVSNADTVFFDRGIPDVHAYLNYISVTFPKVYLDKSNKYKYDKVFMMPPWEEIYITDSERYESFEQSLAIHNHLKRSYEDVGYNIIEVPFGSVKERTEFILSHL